MPSFTDTIDLLRNVVPISKASSSIAALLKRTTTEGAPIVLTQKGYPSAVLLSIAHYEELLRRAGVRSAVQSEEGC